jgi:hypothetical protein
MTRRGLGRYDPSSYLGCHVAQQLLDLTLAHAGLHRATCQERVQGGHLSWSASAGALGFSSQRR